LADGVSGLSLAASLLSSRRGAIEIGHLPAGGLIADLIPRGFAPPYVSFIVGDSRGNRAMSLSCQIEQG
jgi:hypothetical protein